VDRLFGETPTATAMIATWKMVLSMALIMNGPQHGRSHNMI
jgi:hypothetical protein